MDIIIKPPPQKAPEDITVSDLRTLSKDSLAWWVLTSGLSADGNAIDFERHRYLLPIYMDNSNEIVWQKAAQLGATTYMMARQLWWLLHNQGRKGGLYLPNKELVDNTSRDRLEPMMASVPELAELASRDEKLGLKSIGKSSFYLFHMGGKSAKDSVPLDYLSIDEVRLMQDKDVDQTLERIAHSPYKFRVFMSTCGLPEANINHLFDGGTKHTFKAKCGCSDGCDLARTFPACVVADDPKRPEPYLRCPKCKWEIKDRQNGMYVPENRTAPYHSYHASQLNSKYISVKEIWDFFKRTKNLSEFYNAKLGLPFIDEASRGVTPGQVAACVDPQLRWGPTTKKGAKVAMGVDQGAGYLMVVIMALVGGKREILWTEIIEAENPRYFDSNGNITSPFERLHKLMEEFKVNLALVDGMPNVNDAMKFCQAYPRRAFLGYYSRGQKEVVQWLDKKMKAGVKKAGALLRFKHTASIGRFSSLALALGRWSDREVGLPPPDAMFQDCFDEATNIIRTESPARRLMSHLTRLVKQLEVSDTQMGEGTWTYIFVGKDPHLAHAFNYANVALERISGSTSFVFA